MDEVVASGDVLGLVMDTAFRRRFWVVLVVVLLIWLASLLPTWQSLSLLWQLLAGAIAVLTLVATVVPHTASSIVGSTVERCLRARFWSHPVLVGAAPWSLSAWMLQVSALVLDKQGVSLCGEIAAILSLGTLCATSYALSPREVPWNEPLLRVVTFLERSRWGFGLRASWGLSLVVLMASNVLHPFTMTILAFGLLAFVQMVTRYRAVALEANREGQSLGELQARRMVAVGIAGLAGFVLLTAIGVVSSGCGYMTTLDSMLENRLSKEQRAVMRDVLTEAAPVVALAGVVFPWDGSPSHVASQMTLKSSGNDLEWMRRRQQLVLTASQRWCMHRALWGDLAMSSSMGDQSGSLHACRLAFEYRESDLKYWDHWPQLVFRLQGPDALKRFWERHRDFVMSRPSPKMNMAANLWRIGRSTWSECQAMADEALVELLYEPDAISDWVFVHLMTNNSRRIISEPILREVLEHGPQPWWFHLRLGTGDDASADRPQSLGAILLFQVGQAGLGVGDIGIALRCAEFLESEFQQEITSVDCAALLYSRAGSHSRARRIAEDVLTRDPASALSAEVLARTVADEGDLPGAIQILERTNKEVRESATLLLTAHMKFTHYRSFGDLTLAQRGEIRDLLTKATRLQGGTSLSGLVAARLEALDGRAEHAIRHLLEARQMGAPGTGVADTASEVLDMLEEANTTIDPKLLGQLSELLQDIAPECADEPLLEYCGGMVALKRDQPTRGLKLLESFVRRVEGNKMYLRQRLLVPNAKLLAKKHGSVRLR